MEKNNYRLEISMFYHLKKAYYNLSVKNLNRWLQLSTVRGALKAGEIRFLCFGDLINVITLIPLT